MKSNLIYGVVFANMLCEEFDPEKIAGGVDGYGSNNAELMAAAQKERMDDENKRKKDDMKRQLDIDQYDQEYEALGVRRSKALLAAETTALKSTTAENTKFATEGGETKAHREILEKIQEAFAKEKQAVEAKYQSDKTILRSKNPNGYNSSRRY